MADLAVLRTAKLALAEDLICRDDFDIIKGAFIKAQQIKAGMDAGFLREDDYVDARDAFLHALDFQVDRVPPLPSHNNSNHNNNRYSGAPSSVHIPRPVNSQPAVSSPTASTAAWKASPAGPSALSPARASTMQHPPTHPPSPAPSQPSQPPPMTRAYNISQTPRLDDLPKVGKANSAFGKRSMSGIAVQDVCINVFNHIKTKSTFKWVVYKIDDAGNDVVAEQVGEVGSSYSTFVAALPPMQCRYGVFDYGYMNNDTHQTINKLVFVNWAPEDAPIRTKMMYASTKDFFKGFLDGVGAELQATEPADLEESEMREKVHQAMTRK